MAHETLPPISPEILVTVASAAAEQRQWREECTNKASDANRLGRPGAALVYSVLGWEQVEPEDVLLPQYSSSGAPPSTALDFLEGAFEAWPDNIYPDKSPFFDEPKSWFLGSFPLWRIRCEAIVDAISSSHGITYAHELHTSASWEEIAIQLTQDNNPIPAALALQFAGYRADNRHQATRFYTQALGLLDHVNTSSSPYFEAVVRRQRERIAKALRELRPPIIDLETLLARIA